jgi:hypothetical protein
VGCFDKSNIPLKKKKILKMSIQRLFGICFVIYKIRRSIHLFTSFFNQRAARSVVFSDLFNLNRSVYMYVLSCVSLFQCTIIHLAWHQSLIHTEFCRTRVASKIIYVHVLTATLYPCISWLLS